jgi:hypothetical protein
MRTVLFLSLAAMLAACSNQPKASDEELEEFNPPTVQLRGDIVPRQERRFDRLDNNADGVVTADEFPKRRPERFKRFDVNNDGKVTKSELVEGALNRFDRLDANKDQQVTPQEREAAGNSF